MSVLNRLFKGKQLNTDVPSKDVTGENPYYLHKAEVWKKVRFYAVFFLILVLLVIYLLNFKSLQFENFYYFFSDFKASVTAKSYEEISMEYISDPSQSLTVYRGGLCVAGTHNVSIFTSGSRQVISDTVNLSNPVAVASDKNVLVYDQGGYEFLVYNSFSNILDETLDEPILTGAVSERGDLAVVTTGTDNISCVYLYNSSMDRIARIRKNTYVMQVAYDPSTSHLAVVSLDGIDGVYQLKVESYKVKSTVSSEPEYTVTYSGSFPLYASYTADKVLTVVCDNRLLCLNTSGKILTDYSYDLDLVAVSTSTEGCALAFDSNMVMGVVRLMAWNEKGKNIFDSTIQADAEQIVLSDGYVWMKGETLTRVDLSTGRADTSGENVAGKTLLVSSSENILLCSASKASFYQVDKMLSA